MIISRLHLDDEDAILLPKITGGYNTLIRSLKKDFRSGVTIDLYSRQSMMRDWIQRRGA